MISKGANNWNDGLYIACKNGDMEIVKLMISKGANNWNDGLYMACENGDMEIVKLMISEGANNWNGGLCMACKEEHLELISLMISKGATEISEYIKYPLDKVKIIKLLELEIKRNQLKEIDEIEQLYEELD